MRKVAERVPWLLTSLGVALLVIGVLLGPAGQSQSLAQGTGGGSSCAGESVCDPNKNCFGSQIEKTCTTNACDSTVDGCGNCTCKLKQVGLFQFVCQCQ